MERRLLGREGPFPKSHGGYQEACRKSLNTRAPGVKSYVESPGCSLLPCGHTRESGMGRMKIVPQAVLLLLGGKGKPE